MSEADFEQGHTLRGLLLPLIASDLLLPNAAVVEVLSYPEVTASDAGAPDWLLGHFGWRGLSLPLVSWDHLLGQENHADEGLRKRVAVCHLFSASHRVSFVGVETHGLPQLTSLTQADLQAVPDSSINPESCMLGEVSLENSVVGIPDLDALGRLIEAAAS